MKYSLLTSVLLIIFFYPLRAHGDLDLRIEAVNALIETYPDSAHLYFKRGKLKFLHEEYEASVLDINTSISKGYINDVQQIYLSKSLFRLGKFEESLSTLSIFLKKDPNNVVGLKLKAQIFFEQKKFESSALLYEKVINLSIRSLPENYLEAAEAWEMSSRKDKYEMSVKILESGIQNLGPIITFQNKLIQCHLDNNSAEKAIETQLAIIESKRRKESAYVKLAEIYMELDKIQEAKRAAISAKIHFEKLPERIQRNAAMQALKLKIQQLITIN